MRLWYLKRLKWTISVHVMVFIMVAPDVRHFEDCNYNYEKREHI